PRGSAPNGTYPWGTIAGISPSAQFIWGDTLDAGSPTDAHYLVFRSEAPISPPNQPPTAGNDTATTRGNTAVKIPVATLLANDHDPDGDTIRVTGVTARSAEGGTVTINNHGTPRKLTDDFITYTPKRGFLGTDTFQYTIRDSFGWSTQATVTVTVTSA